VIPELEFFLRGQEKTGAPPIVTVTVNPAVDESAAVEKVVPDRKLRCVDLRREPGGGGINVARAVHQLGGEALAVYTCGGPAGKLLEYLLEREGVPHRPVAIHGWTRQNFNVTERSTGRQYRFVHPGPRLARTEWHSCLDALRDFHPAPAYVVASGSLPPGVPEDFYARAARLAAELGARFALDASGEPLERAAREGVFLLKPSLREFAELTGETSTDEKTLGDRARALVRQGACRVLVLSLGSGGVLWAAEKEAGRLAAPAVPVRSTVGAGDALLAGIVLSLTRGLALPEAVRYGVSAAAACVINPGTQLCRREDTERLYAELPACA
jgi:6-phosphofructokinase 2